MNAQLLNGILIVQAHHTLHRNGMILLFIERLLYKCKILHSNFIAVPYIALLKRNKVQLSKNA